MKELTLRETVIDFLEDCGFTPLCEMCEYEPKCKAETSDSCRRMKDIMKSFKSIEKYFKTFK